MVDTLSTLQKIDLTDAPLVNPGRVAMEVRSVGWGFPLFISLRTAVSSSEYLKYDRLRFVVYKCNDCTCTPTTFQYFEFCFIDSKLSIMNTCHGPGTHHYAYCWVLFFLCTYINVVSRIYISITCTRERQRIYIVYKLLLCIYTISFAFCIP